MSKDDETTDLLELGDFQHKERRGALRMPRESETLAVVLFLGEPEDAFLKSVTPRWQIFCSRRPRASKSFRRSRSDRFVSSATA